MTLVFIKRKFWLGLIEEAWQHRNLIWLTGLRRSGKTSLCRSLGDLEYFDAEDLDDRDRLANPRKFYESLNKPQVVIDELHRLDNPSELLKIGADYFPELRIIATGSSTLAATNKFKDSLTGRKTSIKISNMISDDLEDFANLNLDHRFLRGGLPPFFMARELADFMFAEWTESFWAKDIEELFRIDNKRSFMKFFEMLMIFSGGLFEATTFSKACQVARPTIQKYLSILEETHVVSIVRPFHQRPANEIAATPKVFCFDTGFISYFNRWLDLDSERKGRLWEHWVLLELQSKLQLKGFSIYYWRNKQKQEVDFVLLKRGLAPIVVECKWRRDSFEAKNIIAFIKHYPGARNFVVSEDSNKKIQSEMKGLEINFLGLKALTQELLALD